MVSLYEAMFTAEVDRVLDIKQSLALTDKDGEILLGFRERMVVTDNDIDNRVIGFSVRSRYRFINVNVEDLRVVKLSDLKVVGKVKTLVSCDPC